MQSTRARLQIPLQPRRKPTLVRQDGLASFQRNFHMTQTTSGLSFFFCCFFRCPIFGPWYNWPIPKHYGVYCNLNEYSGVSSLDSCPPFLLEPITINQAACYFRTISVDIHPPINSLRSWRAVPQSASAVKGPVLPQRSALQLSSLHRLAVKSQFNPFSQPKPCNSLLLLFFLLLLLLPDPAKGTAVATIPAV